MNKNSKRKILFEFEDEEERLEDFVPVERRLAGHISSVKWAKGKNTASGTITGPIIRVGKASVIIGRDAARVMVGSRLLQRVKIGAAKYNNQIVMLLQVMEEGGHCFYQTKTKHYRTSNRSLSNELISLGLSYGSYKLAERVRGLDGGFIAKPIPSSAK